jgi:hypothetical protein
MANARNPQSVSDKARECRFFLLQMAEYEKQLDTDKFLFCLSAFLSAFRTAAYRLYGVAKTKSGKEASHALQDQLHRHSEIGFLLESANVEVHEDGVVVYHRFRIQASATTPDRWNAPRWAPKPSKWQSRFTPRYNKVAGVQLVEGWQFAGNSKNISELCHDALMALEEIFRRTLAS